MKVRMRTTMAGPGVPTVIAGQTADLPPKIARDLIEKGYAEQVAEAQEKKEEKAQKPQKEAPETATAEPAENAMAQPPRRRRVKKE